MRGASALPELPMGAGSAAHYLATGQTTGGEDDRASFSLRHDTFWVDRE